MFDVVVVGGGVTGCAIAISLGRQGRNVALVERKLANPDRIVGELLQPGGVRALTTLGLADCLQDIEATPVEGYHMTWRDLETRFWFTTPQTESHQHRLGHDGQSMPIHGMSFHHGAFVGKLRAAAQAQKSVTVIEASVREIVRDGASGTVIGVSCCHKETSTQFLAPLVILADGGSSNFRSQFTRQRPSAVSHFWGLELVDAPLKHPRHAHGVLGSGPPLLLYQIDTRTTRILVDIPHKIFHGIGTQASVRAYMREVVLPTLPDAVQASFEKALGSGRLRSMPNAWMPSTRNKQTGLFILGDAANMRHPVTGGGMTVALKDVVLLAQMLHPDHIPSFQDTQGLLKVARRFHWKRKLHSATLNILAQALYFLFVSDDKDLEIMQRGFIRFIQGGPRQFSIPVGLMGGLVENPFLLFYYFFGIALYSMKLHIKQATVLGFPHAVFTGLLVFGHSVRIILPSIVDELRF